MKTQTKKQTEVSISFGAEMWEVTRMDEMLPFHSETTYEDMERYCKEHNYDIRVVYGEDGEAW